MKYRINKQIAIGFAFASIIASTPVLSAEIEEAIITASPHGKTRAEVIGSVNILDGSELQREASATLGETLQNQLGVHSSSFGPGVGTPVIRGQSGKRVEILQNSTVIADVSDTSADHAVATEAFLAERIEILRGPATLRFGGGATGGVVNVINNQIHQESFEGVDGGIEARFTDNNEEQVIAGRVDAGTGNLMFHLDGLFRDSENVEIPGAANLEAAEEDPDDTTFGFIGNSDREAEALNLGLSWVENDFSVGFSVGVLSSNYGLPEGAHGHEEEGEEEAEEAEEFVRIELDQTIYQAKLRQENLPGFFNIATLDLSYNEYEHQEFEFEVEDGVVEAEVGTFFESESLDLRGEITHGDEASTWRGAFGLQYSDRDFEAVGEEAFVPPSTTEVIGLFWLEETELNFGYEPSTLELGLRLDDQSNDSGVAGAIDHTSVNASASLLIPLSESNRLSFIVSGTERAPVSEELLSDGLHIATNTFEVGDQNLDTEQAVNLEVTWAYQSQAENGFNASASIYHNDYSNYIYLFDTELLFNEEFIDEGIVGLDATGLNRCRAEETLIGLALDASTLDELVDEAVECFEWVQDGARFTGFEAELGWSITHSQAVRLWGDIVRATLDEEGDVPLLPPARIGASWSFADNGWDASLSVVHAFEQDRPGENQENTESYTKLNASVGYTVDNWGVFLRGSNLTDEDIRNSTTITREVSPEPGRALTLGARYQF